VQDVARADQFRLSPEDFSFVGSNLKRPESVVATKDGRIFVSDARVLATRIDADGSQTMIGQAGGGLPNGLAIDRTGNLLVADMSLGVVHRIDQAGRQDRLLDANPALEHGAVNFVLADADDTLWISISTMIVPFSEALANRTSDGRILCLRNGVATVVADRLSFTNEIRIDGPREWIYVAETLAGRISRAPLRKDGSLGRFAPFGPDPVYPGAFVDGIALDEDGNVWITELSRNAILVLTPGEQLFEVFSDPDGRLLNKPTSLAFSGSDLRTVLVGSLKMRSLACFESPIAGLPLAHWS
jgi:gluconolactonase